ncbi:response regulator [Luteibacter yeojuensis]|uniref:Response regulatory domain-containing protein n=1 Tax=Luteibacter yeojuensis TaxID=345309 RepID=A0A0F3K0Z5_9GAMM|nr:response regulator [Luteibacter yeojuensis]KJV24846.1 hypothetical protein VI08_20195 [Luteibacter yeojuensis]
MPLRHFPRIVGFEVPPLKSRVDVVHDAPIVGLLSTLPSAQWTNAFILEAAATRGELDSALVSIEQDRILFFASEANARERCNAIRTMVEAASRKVMSGKVPNQPLVTGNADIPANAGRALVVEDDEVLLEVTCDVLRKAGWVATPASTLQLAMEALDGERFDEVIADIDLEVRAEGLGLAREVRQRWPTTAVIVVTGRHAEGSLAVPDGAILLSKPYQRRQLLALLDLGAPKPHP